MILVCLTGLAGLLLVGAIIDIMSRRIPNWLTATVPVLFIVYGFTAPSSVDWSGGLIVAALSFVIGFGLFAFNLMGGGMSS